MQANNNGYLISRQICIDAGHRVTDHGSKCKNLHGHRYTIEAWCRGPVFLVGEQGGMVLDFGFLKEEMLLHIDAAFDHSFIFWGEDALCREMFGLNEGELGPAVKRAISEFGLFSGEGRGGSKICVLPVVPTVEHLAQFWFGTLSPRIIERSSGKARLVCLKVWETPNCWAAYGPETPSQ